MFMTFSAVSPENIRLPDSDNLPIIVGGTVGAFVVVIIVVAFAIFVLRYVSVVVKTFTTQWFIFLFNRDVNLNIIIYTKDNYIKFISFIAFV